METNHTLLWVSLCGCDAMENNLFEKCVEHWDVRRCEKNDNLIKIICKCRPQLACFDYDYPDISGLRKLSHTRSLYPKLPTIIVTRYHSEALVLWALRMHIDDIQFKPVDKDMFIDSIKRLLTKAAPIEKRYDSPALKILFPDLAEKNQPVITAGEKTEPAHAYVKNYYNMKISINDMAQLCNMPSRKFSREFKREYGVSFKDYLMHYRIDMAQQLLEKDKTGSITAVALSVGFNDHSYFTRLFRHYVGITPSTYWRAAHDSNCDKLHNN